MRGSTISVAVVLGVGAFGLGWSAAQTKTPKPQLTAQDYVDIQQLYGRYTHTIAAAGRGAKDGDHL